MNSIKLEIVPYFFFIEISILQFTYYALRKIKEEMAMDLR